MVNKKVRLVVSILIVLGTIAAFWFYLSDHRNLVSQLGRTSLSTIIAVFLLYVVMFGVLLITLDATIRLCFKTISNKENLIINAYSLLINFFVPGQGGPVFRGYYLKKRHALKYRSYITATLFYYLIYGLVGLLMIVLGSQAWWKTLFATIVFVILAVIVSLLYLHSKKLKSVQLDFRTVTVFYLLAATVAQTIIQAIIYSVELHSANSHVAIHQVIAYTGAANLAVFVALTPGAIGIREAFLVFTERLNHVSSANIVVANVIDRSVYLIFLIVLAVALIVISARSTDQTLTDLLPKRFNKKLRTSSQEAK